MARVSDNERMVTLHDKRNVTIVLTDECVIISIRLII